MCAARVFACQGVIRSAVRFEARPSELWFCKDGAVSLGGDFFSAARGTTKPFLLCVLCVVCVVCVPNAPHGQERTAEAQTFQRNPEERGVSEEG